jgi:DNA-binding transcriptional ArsR family regulator
VSPGLLQPADEAVEPPSADRSPRVVALEEADAVLDALASERARAVLADLHASPAPISAVADALDVSIQSAQYHVDRLADAGLVERAGTRYSPKGREMAVYAAVPVAVVCAASDVEVSSGDQPGDDRGQN